MFLTIVATFALLLVALFLYYVVRDLRSPLRAFPGPSPPWSVTGVLGGVVPEVWAEPPIMPQLRWAETLSDARGVLSYRAFASRKLLIINPTWIKHVLVSKQRNYPKPGQQRAMLAKMVGNSLLTTEGQEHRRQRRHMSPAFAFQQLNRFVDVFVDSGRVLASTWGEDQVVDVHRAMAKVTLDVIGLTAFGYDFEATVKDDNKLYTAYNDVLGSLHFSLWNLASRVLGFPTEASRRSERGLAVVRQAVVEIIAKARAAGAGGEEATSLLQLLLHAKESDGEPAFDDESLTDAVMTFLVAGHETSAVSLSWTLLLLAKNPDKQQRLRDEILATYGADGRPASVSELKGMSYLQAVIRETLRLYPAAPITVRQAVEDDEIAGVRVPAGTPVFICAGVQGRLTSLWGKDAGEFRPERFESDAKVDPLAWMPFIVGPRSCIGSNFALSEIAALLTVLVRKFSFELVDGEPEPRPKLFVTQRPYPGLKLRVRRIAE